jgi:hypothetical protein
MQAVKGAYEQYLSFNLSVFVICGLYRVGFCYEDICSGLILYYLNGTYCFMTFGRRVFIMKIFIPSVSLSSNVI